MKETVCPLCQLEHCLCPSLQEMIVGINDHITDKDRPFTGQPHTDQGERGKTEVKGIRFRDLADCVCRAFIGASPLQDKVLEAELERRSEDGTLNYNDLFKLDLSDMDPVALIQNITCEVEKAMGIYPNVPKVEGKSD